jgi:nicotinamidase-related amidase
MKIKNISALVIIDQQKGIAHPKLGLRNNQNAESEMLQLLFQWRKLGWPVFHIKHRSTQIESVFRPDQEGFEFNPEFSPEANEVVIEKKTPCAFTGTNLEILLKEKWLTSIVIVGASTNNSVEATARSGGCKGFSVIVVENACFAFAKTDYFGAKRTAEEVHAMSLANLENEYASIAHSSKLKF